MDFPCSQAGEKSSGAGNTVFGTASERRQWPKASFRTVSTAAPVSATSLSPTMPMSAAPSATTPQIQDLQREILRLAEEFPLRVIDADARVAEEFEAVLVQPSLGLDCQSDHIHPLSSRSTP